MDADLVMLIVMVAATVVVSTRLHARSWPGRPGFKYQRVFSAAFGGLLFLGAGAIGYNLNRSDVFRARTHWVDGPIWWQIALGVLLLALAASWARRGKVGSESVQS